MPVIYACHDSSSYTRLMLFRSKFHVSRVSAAIGVITKTYEIFTYFLLVVSFCRSIVV